MHPFMGDGVVYAPSDHLPPPPSPLRHRTRIPQRRRQVASLNMFERHTIHDVTPTPLLGGYLKQPLCYVRTLKTIFSGPGVAKGNFP